tara:strand:+ start:1080 stop:1187 length:108 start_codon:yes stop_codon:yes gene_type:complete
MLKQQRIEVPLAEIILIYGTHSPSLATLSYGLINL